MRDRLPWDAEYAINFRRLREPEESYWQALWLSASRNEPSPWLLDVGCGDGGFTGCLERRGLSVISIGIDASLEMLSLARQRLPRAFLVLGRAEALPFCSESFDALILSNVIHETGAEMDLANDLARVIRPSGRLVIGLADVEDLPRYWEYEFFPTALKIDAKRLPSVATITQTFLRAGLTFVHKGSVLFERRKFGPEFLERVSQKHMTSLWMIPRWEFENGLTNLKRAFPKRLGETQDVYLNVIAFQK